MDNERISSTARRERRQAKLTLREVARRMQVSAAYLSDLERNRRGWSIVLVSKFNKAIGQ